MLHGHGSHQLYFSIVHQSFNSTEKTPTIKALANYSSSLPIFLNDLRCIHNARSEKRRAAKVIRPNNSSLPREGKLTSRELHCAIKRGRKA